ncbi:peptidoglycan-binding protein [Streptomyces armeniacus]|uniref:Peptidoglycan-binding protein n=1 Tax=Streptomyces armeniacus TaxID=83291 RepID=A0A345XWJ2_9ACTN|nr:peptidoglycan-binding domain-containing protein [Streptomyces armeniacus]AXK36008.1 peptidoglycan-binding protein [Streptomyces armeniacus]
MRTSRKLTRPAALAASVAVAGALFAAPGVVQASEPDTSSSSSAPSKAAAGKGVEAFQERHGLPETGSINTATAKALQKASDAELHKTFRTAADLPPAELENARTVIGVGKGAQIPEQGQVIALMTAMQESKFVNYLEPVDHDSLGIFQQRPSTGWGTPEQITHVPTSSKSFYGVAPFGSNPGLIQIPNWETRPPGEVCDAVQHSAFPERYAQWEQFARDLLAAESPTVPPIP